MDVYSSEIVGIIYQLLPGFLVAWILYGLTAYTKPTPFERVVQALIFTVIVRVLLLGVREISFTIGEKYSVGIWTEDVNLTWSVLLAGILGLTLTWCVNNDFPLFLFRKDGVEKCWKGTKWISKALSKIRMTNKTLHPTEWYTALNTDDRFIVLHLKGGRRLYGWPRQYPDTPNNGHFLIDEPEWLLDNGSAAPLHTVNQLLIPASDVEMIELLKEQLEIEVEEKEMKAVFDTLTNLYVEEAENVDKCTETTPD